MLVMVRFYRDPAATIGAARATSMNKAGSGWVRRRRNDSWPDYNDGVTDARLQDAMIFPPNVFVGIYAGQTLCDRLEGGDSSARLLNLW
jgi:hypothetical protein